ncbi:DNA-directed RNA polymerase specialized sigma24 family protein [Sphingopyxis sp. OAS728]|uniref:iron dicitrate transport regulator FecR n=1 Tax=Sphingopyxis sp. OAS728 TaxID=2663823 RepID=UPI00178A38B5|nr:iron dicitrate transport regulator FecR [Sphingopyxis sp. OAS728]MBE1526729.1 DNA-directed RNA polymerase specialized sigma24 family protein [Sphingopyxis sp. OAS728]
MRRRDLSTVTIADAERRMVIALRKMTARQGDIFLSVRFDNTPYPELAERHGVTVEHIIADFACTLLMWSRCLHARFPRLVWPWL